MAALSNYLRNKIIDHVLRTATFTKPTALYLALFTSATDADNGGAEVSGGAYARVNLPPLDTNWNATQGGTTGASSGSTGLTDNAVDINFPIPSGANWGVITHFRVYDAITGGNPLIYGALGTPKTVNDGDPGPQFLAGQIDLTLS